ncbi:MAG: DNA polymerase III subunit epsilon [Zymomonas mobilis subsp. pomaceae]|uniref:DNA polymerase III subunit epsilon n=1 Tax=Zymomonas mobilis subsp. pomaceae (strain ATCC 29192 / DSM 22645 / JCM 10191 / CCUG 17912 / NBRC 13757 / NCIMB 11200 / NRRL B-4491 / Barker I) TaxID=579138 RepID=F8ETV5_ZYMMT|nr:DNA polymerase III subunit epsilon [Zymomonas mobilis]AEI38052.1 DNA polymerase III, epsilon subunit [Zymomonas mobilis subsp. pomaceae ATCC 29192]MDX5949418.1 DNA polymerase III subunit epsilon [Zymomonas mobilis subsp. pomaceae]
MREIVFDTETTGLSPIDGDRLVEIGCVELINKVETGRSFHCYFNPERPMNAVAESIHGLSDKFLADKPLFAEKAKSFLDFIGFSPLVAHNAAFDFGFLNHELGRCGYSAICMTRMVDTLAIARSKHPGAKHTLDALCTRYGIDRSHRVKHGALLDAQLLAQLYVELTGGRQIGMALGDDSASGGRKDGYNTASQSKNRKPRRNPRPHQASPQELLRHGAFIDKISDPVWRQA